MLEWFASLGVGGVLAGVIFFWHRRDTQVYQATLIELHSRAAERETALLTTVRENTAAITVLTTIFERFACPFDREQHPRDAG